MAYKSVLKFLRTNAVWIVCAVLFFVGTFALTRFTHLFISPDETANAFFVRAFAHTGSFRVFDAMNIAYEGILHPRSIITDGAFLLPVSFLGLTLLYGSLTALLGSWSLTLITPTLVILAAFAWNKILERWFSKRIAFISSLLLLFHPAVWYYSARGLMPNVLFVCCVIFAAFFLLHFNNKKTPPSTTLPLHHSFTFFLSGFFLSLALVVRLSEVYWLIPLFVALLVVERKTFSLRKICFLAIGFAIPMLTLLFFNFKTYSAPFMTGYSFVSSMQRVTTTTRSEDLLSWLLPFGFHPRAVFWNTRDYLLLLFWWLTIPTLCALPIVWKNKKQKMYLLASMLVAFWLCIWYGSWRLNDNPDPTQITIANSYVRYWLPLFVMSTPLIATSMTWISECARSKKHQTILLFSCLLLVVALNVRIVYLEGQDALVRVVATLQRSEEIRDEVLTIVPENGVIITDRSDKIFFPGRHVLVPLRSEKTFAMIPKMLEQTPVYYYGITFPQIDLDYLNQQKLGPLGAQIEFIQSFGVESLYRITRP
ncbi:hypothetical protein A3C09_00540 [Candidatus Uhrbacteria bacterium RIFCSPHIGHO2_02_FULL_47_44]|uniref:Glycosyltransferase RgtA/B/C/D-like domain-containing protein n=1 Tax=Candidatus Uhrbacteria bacterium RIFCSPLOWO2_02_FULL_48_18 TaxID=1802408 RepID=A0A1F7V8R2_9BACT|nr:MAG: hypothetical protein A2839_04045 [Candidatus Uhrbacteria bacterium RIFCSPHIGHO2_01_FULL_47_10]OGL70825.1 MAG: hypothetical protein A3C09_00540 [Candidatus Uhrbacteria bacterium RIFCSPHIGHO2_02_FULL_47_44]OGL76693.1 MAG: hypothetical protein A3E97_02140 [Candidatus Uhrbacteria bacterium RIFCSPHIGHO2_12_FULL_47_12]OGL82584.1 MAG: hypothetical protein A3B20_00060 [Candidatus Uhrbacteria bacterium RIFCSPLOWO2_01_FULL_47_17]OGL86795.1 MAG: hypothetical protein A3I41_04430 [Candidatus Uhrbact